MTAVQPRYECEKCVRFKSWGKYSCKTCLRFYTDNFKLAKEYDHTYLRKVAKKERLEESDPKLRVLYQRIKERYFDGNYLPDSRYVAFLWKRGNSRGGSCWKGKKLIKIGGEYKNVFEGTSVDMPHWTLSLVRLMIHEAVHLRLAHHRKSFKRKVEETVTKVKLEDLRELYTGLIGKEV